MSDIGIKLDGQAGIGNFFYRKQYDIAPEIELGFKPSEKPIEVVKGKPAGFAAGKSTRTQFAVGQAKGLVVVQVFSGESGELIVQIPSRVQLKIREYLRDYLDGGPSLLNRFA